MLLQIAVSPTPTFVRRIITGYKAIKRIISMLQCDVLDHCGIGQTDQEKPHGRYTRN
jgi:hypothetical protein